MAQVLFLAWLIFITIQSIVVMFTESFFGGIFSWFVLAFILPSIFGVFDDI